MSIRTVRSHSVPEPPPQLYSNCKRSGDLLFLSGLHAGDGKGGVVGEGSAFEQARETFRKIRDLVETAGGKMDDVVRLVVYVTDIAERGEVSRARREFFTGDFPCSTLVQISALVDPKLKVEIEATAVLRGAE